MGPVAYLKNRLIEGSVDSQEKLFSLGAAICHVKRDIKTYGQSAQLGHQYKIGLFLSLSFLMVSSSFYLEPVLSPRE